LIGTRLRVNWQLEDGTARDYTARVENRVTKRPRRDRAAQSEYKYLLQWEDGDKPAWSRVAHRPHSVVETPPAGGRTAVLVRSHRPTANAIRRVVQWAESLRTMDPPVDTWWSLDVTSGDEALRMVKRTLSELGCTCIRMHTYCAQDMLDLYPALAGMLPKIAPIWKHLVGPKGNPFAWGFHVEAINLWHKSASVMAYDFVWVTEDDVGFTGQFSSLVEHYRPQVHVDLITEGCDQTRPWYPKAKQDKGWMYHDTVSDQYSKLVPEQEQYRTHEHCQRFSCRLLEQLHLLSADGCIAWSEQSSISLCAVLPGFVHSPFERRHIGSVYSYNGRVSEAEYEELLQGAGSEDQLVHALKW
jgi:hypothetical protein